METTIAKERIISIPTISEDTWFTSSINLIAFLKVKGVKYESIEEYNGKKVFKYKKTDDLEKNILEYKNNEFMQLFVSELSKIKGIVKA